MPPCIIYHPGWWPDAEETFALLHTEIAWEQRDITMFGRTMLIMRDESQQEYAHAVPRTARPVGPRINLTFRTIQPDQAVVSSSIAPAN
jgi:hypothetical protein